MSFRRTFAGTYAYIWFVFDIDNSLTAPRFPSRTLITGAHRHRRQFPLAPNLSSGVGRRRALSAGGESEARAGVRAARGAACGTRPLRLGSIDSPRGLPATRHPCPATRDAHSSASAVRTPAVIQTPTKMWLKASVLSNREVISPIILLLLAKTHTAHYYLLECLRFAVVRLDIVEVVHWSDRLAPRLASAARNARASPTAFINRCQGWGLTFYEYNF